MREVLHGCELGALMLETCGDGQFSDTSQCGWLYLPFSEVNSLRPLCWPPLGTCHFVDYSPDL